MDHKPANPYQGCSYGYAQGSTLLGIGPGYQASAPTDLIQTRHYQFNVAGDKT
jgi:hypothetical protein